MSTRITRQEISIDKRMDEILHHLRKKVGSHPFHELFPVAEKQHMIVSFLAILELMKRNEVLVNQDKNFSEIMVEAVKGVIMVG